MLQWHCISWDIVHFGLFDLRSCQQSLGAAEHWVQMQIQIQIQIQTLHSAKKAAQRNLMQEHLCCSHTGGYLSGYRLCSLLHINKHTSSGAGLTATLDEPFGQRQSRWGPGESVWFRERSVLLPAAFLRSVLGRWTLPKHNCFQSVSLHKNVTIIYFHCSPPPLRYRREKISRSRRS